MRSIAWLVVAGLVTTAHAAPPAHLSVIKPDPQGDAELLELTKDPLLARADRISGEERRGMVAFTFDDGPNPETSPAVIEALLAYDIPATFFIVTKRLEEDASREILKREMAAGFLVGSHTVTHKKLRRASPLKLAAEIDDSIRALSKEAARPIGMFRAPFGAVDKRAREWIQRRGLTEVFWSIDTLDWKAKDPLILRHKILTEILAQEGGVVLMHDVKPITAEIVASVFDDLEAENCRRLAQNRDPILPVSIHYFLRDNKHPRDIPDDVRRRTDAYRMALPARCVARAEAEANKPFVPPPPPYAPPPPLVPQVSPPPPFAAVEPPPSATPTTAGATFGSL